MQTTQLSSASSTSLARRPLKLFLLSCIETGEIGESGESSQSSETSVLRETGDTGESGPPMSNTVFLRYTQYFTIFQYDAIDRDIFQAKNWSKICLISSRI